MDILEPLEGSDNAEDTDEKMMLEEIHIKRQAMDSDDETNVDHLSPQTLLETPGEHEVQYSVRSPEGGVITYRVLQVNDNNVDGLPQIVAAGSPPFGGQGPQLVTSNASGQLYVIGNGGEVFSGQAGVRAIAPRSSMADPKDPMISTIRKKDERRRATHNEVERRRRDKINNWISKLASLIPGTSGEIKASQYDGQSKGGILAKACDYIMDLNDVHDKHEELLNENKKLQESLGAMKKKNSDLSAENKELKAMLKKNGILYVPSEIHS